MKLTQLKTFLWVAKLGGFRRASEKLHTSQPAISARISALEDALGARLFERGATGITLSAKGHELLAYAEQVEMLVDTIRHRIGSAAVFEGVLRLGVSETIVHSWLPRFLTRLSIDYPLVDVELTVDVSAALRDDLLNRALDLAFLMGPISEYSVSNLELPGFPLSWYAGGRIAEAARTGAGADLIARYPVVTYARNTRPYREIKAELQRRHGPVVRIFASSALAACFQMVRDGVALGTLPVSLAEPRVQAGEMIEVAMGWRPADLRFTASYVSDPTNLLAAAAAELARSVAAEEDA
jgi:DNA-binding transcriptional LysR family regulator